MKIAGWILLVLGILSGIGSLMAGHNPAGFFWAALGGFLIYRADQKKREKEEAEKWKNGNGQTTSNTQAPPQKN